MVKDHSDSEKGNPLPPHGLLFPISSKGYSMSITHRHDSTYHGLCYASTPRLVLLCPSPTYMIAHTTAFVTPVVEHWLEREIAQWVHPMKDRSDDPLHHERTVLPRSYISFPAARALYMNRHRIAHTTATVTPVVQNKLGKEIAQKG